MISTVLTGGFGRTSGFLTQTEQWMMMVGILTIILHNLLLNNIFRGLGWEYAVEAGMGAWVPYERNVHLSRRRRWARLRKRDKDSKAIEKKRVCALYYSCKLLQSGWILLICSARGTRQ
jgi:hypothetical protein